MTEKRFQKRYIEKNNKVHDSWKKMPITNELNSDSLLNVISHLNGLGEIIDRQIEQGRYCFGKYYELKEENQKLKKALKELKEIDDYQEMRIIELQEFEDTVFDSLNNKIKDGEKAIEWGKSIGADVGSMGFHIELLKKFKKELFK